MTHQDKVDIVEKAITIVLGRGYEPKTPDDATMCSPLESPKDVRDYWDFDIWPNEAIHIIFNHDFAKALWGESLIQPKDEDGDYLYTSDGYDEYVYWLPAWQYHLQQMVIADDPIKYLGEHLDG